MKKTKTLFVSIIIPTYNAQKFIDRCLRSIQKQNYPKTFFEVLVIDGGSSDKTLEIAKKYRAKILKNPFKDAESGKAIGIEHARGDIIGLIDADNELVEKNWLTEMVKPLQENEKIFGVESPWYVRKKDPLINQYVTLLVIADPLARRFHPHMQEENKGSYVIYHLKTGQTPVIGANGFLWRKKYIKLINRYKPKFEEVNYISLMVEHGYLVYAKVKHVGIHHYYCTSLGNYIKKRAKIGRKFMLRKQKGQTTWVDQSRGNDFLLGILYNVSIIGPTLEMIKELIKTKKIAWVWHPVISFITIIIYAYTFFEVKIKSLFHQKTYA
ncbi:MAG TPA: glycosyltransferase [Candidatus Saccharimonadales bacterium]|nr:glycosyltransferase [Candidatus Saccharimonadales bacterium]